MVRQAFVCALVIGASVLAGSCKTPGTGTGGPPPDILISIDVTPPPPGANCTGQNQLTFSSQATPQYVDACGKINLYNFPVRGRPIDIQMSIATNNFGFNATSGKDALEYAEQDTGTKTAVSQGRFPHGITHLTKAGDIRFKYNAQQQCVGSSGNCPQSKYGIFLSQNGAYFETIDPIIVNQP